MAAFGVWVAGGRRGGGGEGLGGACSSWLLRRGRGLGGGGGGGRCVFGARRNKVVVAVSVGWVRAVPDGQEEPMAHELEEHWRGTVRLNEYSPRTWLWEVATP